MPESKDRHLRCPRDNTRRESYKRTGLRKQRMKNRRRTRGSIAMVVPLSILRLEQQSRLHVRFAQSVFRESTAEPSRLTGTQVDTLRGNLQKFLDDPECGKLINAMLGSLPNDVWKTSKYGGSLMDNFNRIKNGGGFCSGDTISKNAQALTDPNTMTTTFDSQQSAPLITGQPWQQLWGNCPSST